MTADEIDALYAEFGHRVRTRRKWSGMKAQDLARLVGLSPASISNIEAGRQRLRLDTAGKIAQALDVELMSLVTPPWRHTGVSVTP